MNITRTGRKVQIFLTMCHPAMFTLIASPQVNLPRLKTFTCAVHQCATDGLKNKGGKKKSRRSQINFMVNYFHKVNLSEVMDVVSLVPSGDSRV